MSEPYDILVAGIGGTGVVTIGQILAMAAHIEGRGCSVLDMSGLAQKGGPVMSHVRLAARQSDIYSTRVGTGAARLVIGCDVIVAASRDALSRMGEGRTHAALNATATPTAAFVRNPDWQYPGALAEQDIRHACSSQLVDTVDAGFLAPALLGDTLATNMFMLGYAWQKAWVPLSHAAIDKALALNGVAVEFNRHAFALGRLAAHDLAAVTEQARRSSPGQAVQFVKAPSLDAVVARRIEFLSAYQNAAYAERYRDFVAQVRQAESRLQAQGPLRLTEAVARYLFKLMAYKDEYEVARLHTDPAFAAKVSDMFEGDYRIRYHLAPPVLARRDAQGHLKKQSFGAWMRPTFNLLARMRFLRGSMFDPFGYTQERKVERQLIERYRQTIADLLPELSLDKLKLATAIASIPEEIRGYGHIKQRHLEAALAKEAALLNSWRNPSPVDAQQTPGVSPASAASRSERSGMLV